MKELYSLYKKLIKDFQEDLPLQGKLNFVDFKTATFPAINQNLDRYANSSSISYNTVSYLDPKRIGFNIWIEYKNRPINKEIFNYINKHNLWPFEKVSYESDLGRQPSISQNLIADFIRRLFELSGNKFNFSDNTFEIAFKELKDFIINEKFKYKILNNLYGPLGLIDKIALGNANIKKADYEISKLFCFHYTTSETLNNEMLENDYYIEIEREIYKKDWFEESSKDYDHIRKIFNILSLSSHGNIEIGRPLRISNAWPLIKTERIHNREPSNKYNMNNPFRYEISKETENSIIQNFTECKSINFDKLDDKIKSSIKRFQNSKSTLDVENKIIELVLSIEYIINTKPFEVTYQLILKIIKLYDEQNQDVTLNTTLKKFFNLRGDVVHGNKKVKKTIDNIGIIHRVEKLTQKIIIRIILLNQKYSLKKINDALEKTFIVNKTIKEILEEKSA